MATTAAHPLTGSKRTLDAVEAVMGSAEQGSEAQRRLIGVAFFTSALMGLVPLQQLIQQLKPLASTHQNAKSSEKKAGAGRPSKHCAGPANCMAEATGADECKGVMQAAPLQQLHAPAPVPAQPQELAGSRQQQAAAEQCSTEQAEAEQQQQQQAEPRQQQAEAEQRSIEQAEQQQQHADAQQQQAEAQHCSAEQADSRDRDAMDLDDPASDAADGCCGPLPLKLKQETDGLGPAAVAARPMALDLSPPTTPTEPPVEDHPLQLQQQQSAAVYAPLCAQKPLRRAQLRQQLLLQQTRVGIALGEEGAPLDSEPPQPARQQHQQHATKAAGHRSTRGARLLGRIKEQQQQHQQGANGSPAHATLQAHATSHRSFEGASAEEAVAGALQQLEHPQGHLQAQPAAGGCPQEPLGADGQGQQHRQAVIQSRLTQSPIRFSGKGGSGQLAAGEEAGHCGGVMQCGSGGDDARAPEQQQQLELELEAARVQQGQHSASPATPILQELAALPGALQQGCTGASSGMAGPTMVAAHAMVSSAGDAAGTLQQGAPADAASMQQQGQGISPPKAGAAGWMQPAGGVGPAASPKAAGGRQQQLSPGPSPLLGGQRGCTAAALRRVGQFVNDLGPDDDVLPSHTLTTMSPAPLGGGGSGSGPCHLSKRRRLLLSVMSQPQGSPAMAATASSSDPVGSTLAAAAVAQQEAPQALFLTSSPANFEPMAADSKIGTATRIATLQPPSPRLSPPPASPQNPFPGFWHKSDAAAGATPAGSAVGMAAAATQSQPTPELGGLQPKQQQEDGQQLLLAAGVAAGEQDGAVEAGRRERKVRFAVENTSEEDDEALPRPTPPKFAAAAGSRPGTPAKPRGPLKMMRPPMPPPYSRFGSTAFRRYNGPAGRRAVLLSFVADGSNCVALAPPPPPPTSPLGGAGGSSRSAAGATPAAAAGSLDPLWDRADPLQAGEDAEAELPASDAGILGAGTGPEGATPAHAEVTLHIPRRLCNPHALTRRLSMTDAQQLQPQDSALQDLREAFLNARLADNWRRGESWARLDLSGVELDANRVPQYQQRAEQLCTVLGEAQGQEKKERVVSQLEGEWRHLQSMRQRYAAGTVVAAAAVEPAAGAEEPAAALGGSPSAASPHPAAPAKQALKGILRGILKQPSLVSALGPCAPSAPLQRSPGTSPAQQQAVQSCTEEPAAAAEQWPEGSPASQKDLEFRAPLLSNTLASAPAPSSAAAMGPPASPPSAPLEQQQQQPSQQQQLPAAGDAARVEQASCGEAAQAAAAVPAAAARAGTPPAASWQEAAAPEPHLQLTPGSLAEVQAAGEREGEGEGPLELTADAAVELTPGPAPSRGFKMLQSAAGGIAAAMAAAGAGGTPRGPSPTHHATLDLHMHSAQGALSGPAAAGPKGGVQGSAGRALGGTAGAVPRQRVSRGARLLQALQVGGSRAGAGSAPAAAETAGAKPGSGGMHGEGTSMSTPYTGAACSESLADTDASWLPDLAPLV